MFTSEVFDQDKKKTLSCVFKCNQIGQIIDLCNVISSYKGKSMLYKDKKNNFCLFIEDEPKNEEIFNKYKLLGSEWCDTVQKEKKSKLKIKSVIISDGAIKALSQIN